MAIHELPNERRLFHHIPPTLRAGHKHPQKGLIFLAAPVLGQDRIPFAKLESRHPPVAVDEHPGRHRNHRDDLSPLFDGCGQGDQGLPLDNPRVSVSELQMCDLHFQDFHGVHLPYSPQGIPNDLMDGSLITLGHLLG